MGDSVQNHSPRVAPGLRVAGANESVGVGLIGCGARGLGVGHSISQISQARGAEIRGVADVYGPRRDQAANEFGTPAKPHADYRSVLDCKDIDAVVVATPDHLHVPVTLAAIDAGKDVYLEKPVTHRLAEGDALLSAAEISGRVIATGTQQRSWDHFLAAKCLVDQGVLGNVSFVRCYWNQDYSALRSAPLSQVDPTQLDWKQWLGPARSQPFSETRFRFWRFFWDFGGGSATDLMTHWIDVVQWFLNRPRAATVHATAATYVHDWLEAPDTVVATIEFPGKLMVVYEGNMTFGLLGCGIEFRGDKAMMVINRTGYAVYEEGTRPLEAVSLPEPMHRFVRSDDTSRAERVDGPGTLDNVRNWVDCIRSGKTPRASLRAGVECAATAHLVNKSIRERRTVTVEP